MRAPAAAKGCAALLQLASPLLPVGAFAYSQGLERAVHDGLVHDAASASRWILDALEGPLARFEWPVLARLCEARAAGDGAAFAVWNERYLASRDSAELRAETLQMGASLAALARDLPLPAASQWLAGVEDVTLPAAFAACATAMGLSIDDALSAGAWGWLENQVSAALKAVPLGQVAGQRILLAAHAPLERALAGARGLGDHDLASAAPGLALSSALHETQYSRLFRS
jgi:urease accessory protein